MVIMTKIEYKFIINSKVIKIRFLLLDVLLEMTIGSNYFNPSSNCPILEICHISQTSLPKISI